MLDDLAAQALHDPGMVVVHGGSDATTRLQAVLGRPARFLESPSGQSSRRTDRLDLEAFAMATGLLNRQLVEGLLARGVKAFGCSGIDGGMVRGPRKEVVRAVENGRVRLVRDQWTGRPQFVNASLLRSLLQAECLPVLAPVIAGEAGEMLNADGDRLAASVAAALKADDLVILSNVPGLLADPDRENSLIPHLGLSDFDTIGRCARGRMRKKLLGAREALCGGVKRVILADARRDRPLSRALQGEGTVIEGRSLVTSGGGS